ncbi:BMC domain-containing protein [Clostridium sp. Ade.TY]|uniref:ethanolamine utilization microcompartment protein EutS n=1 Tax=Clostridium sp. Ade.TY TaxID=1391647 RepID=UPI0003FE4A8C|nr:BMC domain-containing protein [Clostridium sp. Ade.TY]
MNIFDDKEVMRVVQEYVPGKQVTLAHLIANPVDELYKKLGLVIDKKGALGIMTITPSEASIIAADVATKSSDISIGFIDRFSGSLVIVGSVSAVEEALKEVIKVLSETLKFTSTIITKS